MSEQKTGTPRFCLKDARGETVQFLAVFTRFRWRMGAMQIYLFNLHKIVAISGTEIEHEHHLMFPECSLSHHIIFRPRHVASMATKQALHGAFLCLVRCCATEKFRSLEFLRRRYGPADW
ncbi:hypothetical protein P6U16_16455 [Rhizobium sp. 32-5/1]|uniref:hypothetical protein n=1 Tax=Rhizobium sp. 32-5/1 TaxID=3019602 RepID=UPI00240D082F|nr:hypothetical protein [Rhizobium sp. 32-5/1]WEZ82629.1 hypothetical protein P6U16_16455 [Rhizobium sp. 32-5/1]